MRLITFAQMSYCKHSGERDDLGQRLVVKGRSCIAVPE